MTDYEVIMIVIIWMMTAGIAQSRCSLSICWPGSRPTSTARQRRVIIQIWNCVADLYLLDQPYLHVSTLLVFVLKFKETSDTITNFDVKTIPAKCPAIFTILLLIFRGEASLCRLHCLNNNFCDILQTFFCPSLSVFLSVYFLCVSYFSVCLIVILSDCNFVFCLFVWL